MDALFWANSLGIGNTVFRYLAVGDRFHFKDGNEIFQKTSDRGWYQNEAGRKFRTGGNAAVFKVAL